MHPCADDLFDAVIQTTADRLGRTVCALWEDVGTWLCTHPPLESVRRLIRFSGPTYEDLLWSLDEMHDRARLAVPDLDLPTCRVQALGSGEFDILVIWHRPWAAALLTGVLRAMADDYGVLALLNRADRSQQGQIWQEQISIILVEADFAAPKDFAFGAPA